MPETTAGKLGQAERLAVHVLVDNVTDIASTTPAGITGHVANVARGDAWALSGSCLCCANWGLSLGLDITGRDGTVTRLLFDAGPDPDTLTRNAGLLGYSFEGLDGIVLSHGHWDHAGGLTAACRPGTPLHANVAMFVRRCIRQPNGARIPFRDPPSPGALEAAGARIEFSPEARLVGMGYAYLSGEIPRLTAYERGLPGHQTWDPAAAAWRDDPLIADERWLAVHLRGKGIVVFTACSHAGVVNVLTHARRVFDPVPIHAVMGGFHLAGPGVEATIAPTVADMARFGLEKIVPGHCTGWRAVGALANAFGERVTPSSVGQTHVF
jgi:7,8-dihydropterin-6-yl-methyl-4-(beta-D-ribofuranosyl)aminobenzene 5'-phosphate synthase